MTEPTVTSEMLSLAEEAVNSSRALSVFASCEWDDLSEHGKSWVAVVIDQAIRQRWFENAIRTYG